MLASADTRYAPHALLSVPPQDVRRTARRHKTEAGKVDMVPWLSREGPMLIELQELVDRLAMTGRQIVEAPTRLEFHRDLLQQIQQVSTLAKAPDLPLFIRSAAKDVEAKANHTARAVESTVAADLEKIVHEMHASLEALRAAIE
jgi:hypothetical protein